MRKNKVTAMVTIDVQGAFDAVLHKRLLHRMRNQGWPRLLWRWVESSLTRRRICVRYQDRMTRDLVVEYGVPQSSPPSPLLLLLFISILFKNGSEVNKFGYADDIAILTTGITAAEAVEMVKQEWRSLCGLQTSMKLVLTHRSLTY